MIHLIDRFTEKLRKGRYNNATIKAYRDAVFMFYNNYREIPQHQIDETLIANYLKDLKVKKSYSPEVVIQNGKAIKLFYKTIFDKELDIKASGLKKQSPPYILSKAEIKNLIESTPNLKHKLIISLAYGLGLKLNEIIELKISDFDFNENTLKVYEDKTNFREIFLPESIIKQIQEYSASKKVESKLLFSNSSGKKISARGVQLYFSRIIEENKMDKSITIQNLRHSFAVHHLNNGIDIHHIQRLLGHKFLQTTTAYIALCDFEIKNLKSPIEDLI